MIMGKIYGITAAVVLFMAGCLGAQIDALEARSTVHNSISVSADAGGADQRGTSTASVDVRTVINGEVVEDVRKESSGGAVHYESSTQSDGARIETNISAHADTGGRSASGADGADGADGKSGRSASPGEDGADGQDGLDGADGEDGADGSSATLHQAAQDASASAPQGKAALASPQQREESAESGASERGASETNASTASPRSEARQPAPASDETPKTTKALSVGSVVNRFIQSMFAYVFSIFS